MNSGALQLNYLYLLSRIHNILLLLHILLLLFYKQKFPVWVEINLITKFIVQIANNKVFLLYRL